MFDSWVERLRESVAVNETLNTKKIGHPMENDPSVMQNRENASRRNGGKVKNTTLFGVK